MFDSQSQNHETMIQRNNSQFKPTFHQSKLSEKQELFTTLTHVSSSDKQEPTMGGTGHSFFITRQILSVLKTL